MNRVCAVAGRSTERLQRALAAQGLTPESVVVETRLLAGLERALASGADWIWVLDGSAAPRPNALQVLLEALDRMDGLPDPALLTGVVITADGRVDPNRSPWYRRFQLDVAMTSADRGLVPVRGCLGPALVDRSAVEATLPHARVRISPSSVLEWTARVLRGPTGYLVPESESETMDAGRDPLRRPATAARLILGGAVGRLEGVAVVLELAERAGRAPSAGR